MTANKPLDLSKTNPIGDLPVIVIVQGSFQSSEVYDKLGKGK